MGRRAERQTARLEVRQSGIQRVTYESIVGAGSSFPATRWRSSISAIAASAVPIYVRDEAFRARLLRSSSMVRRSTRSTPAPTSTRCSSAAMDRRRSRRSRRHAQHRSGRPRLVHRDVRPGPSARLRELLSVREAWYDTSCWSSGPADLELPVRARRARRSSAPATWSSWPGASPTGPQSPTITSSPASTARRRRPDLRGLIEKRWTAALPAGTLRTARTRSQLRLPADTGAALDLHELRPASGSPTSAVQGAATGA